MKISYVPFHKMDLDAQTLVWLQILPFVKKLVKQANGRVTEVSLLNECRTAQVSLWVCYEEDKDGTPVPSSFICTKIREYPGKRLLSYEYCGGERIDEWFETATTLIEEWARKTGDDGPGCDGVEIIGRLGWQRYLVPKGWTQVFSLYEKRFKDVKHG